MPGIKRSAKPIHGSGDYARELNRIDRERRHDIAVRKEKRSKVKASGKTGRPHSVKKKR
jgi:hypothetical protein